jgi:YidC/Oxa1 family membrane protein insertase
LAEYYDPKHEPGAEKRMLVVFLLVFIGIALMMYLIPKPAQPPAEQKPNNQQQQQQQQTQAPAPTSPPSAPAPVKSTTAKQQPPLAGKQASSEAQTVIESNLYKITFTNKGALVKSWILKKYKNDKGQPLDLVNPVTAPVLGYPLSLFSYDKALAKRLNEDLLYVATTTGPEASPTSVTFEYAGSDIEARKTFKFDKSSYVIGIETEVRQNGNVVTAYPEWPGGFGDQTVLSSYGSQRIDWLQNGDITRKPPQSGWFLTGGKKWVADGQTVNGPFDWVATLDQYFASVFMPDSPKDTAAVTLHVQVEIPRNLDKPQEGGKDKASVVGVAVGNTSGITRERLFVGPKAVDVLESTQAQPGTDIRGILDFGFFGFIARPLFLWLKWTHEHWIPNWGWAIAFLTVVINLALLPLRISSMKSSLKMQKIQPQIKAITEKYKRYSLTDPRRADMQKEMSELYKREGVNPVGGCFPLLLQMPFLFAFYSMLGNAIELRQAGWLWVHDLAAADPLHILPVAIIITMFVTQKSTPQAGMDPAQQKMLQLMTPVMMGIISWNLAAGLGIYWAISNIIAWAQQIAINQTEFGKQVRKSVERRAMRKR